MLWALHGQIGDPADWAFLRSSLPQGLSIETPSLWDSVAPYDAWAEAFCGEVRSKDLFPLLMGYSMGGRLALHALLKQPAMWRAGIIVSAHTGLVDRQQRMGRWKADDEWATKIRTTDWMTFLRTWNNQTVFDGAEPPPGDRIQLLKWRSAIIRSFDHWGLSRQADLLPQLETLTMPVLWVTGALDVRYTAIAAEAAAKSSRIQHVIIPEGGHRIPWEQSEAFAHVVSGFIGSLNSAKPDVKTQS